MPAWVRHLSQSVAIVDPNFLSCYDTRMTIQELPASPLKFLSSLLSTSLIVRLQIIADKGAEFVGRAPILLKHRRPPGRMPAPRG